MLGAIFIYLFLNISSVLFQDFNCILWFKARIRVPGDTNSLNAYKGPFSCSALTDRYFITHQCNSGPIHFLL